MTKPTIDDVRRELIEFGYSQGVGTGDYRNAQVIHEALVDEVYKDLLPIYGHTVLDIGAHVGSFTKYALDHGAHHVYALEPFGPSYRDLLANVKAWDAQDRVTVLPCAVGTEQGTATLRVNTRANVAANSTHPARAQSSTKALDIAVPVISLEQLLQCWPMLIKCDCEGAELEIFAPLEVLRLEPLLAPVERIVMELHHNYDGMLEPARDVCYALINAGFEMKPASLPPKVTGWPSLRKFSRKQEA